MIAGKPTYDGSVELKGEEAAHERVDDGLRRSEEHDKFHAEPIRRSGPAGRRRHHYPGREGNERVPDGY